MKFKYDKISSHGQLFMLLNKSKSTVCTSVGITFPRLEFHYNLNVEARKAPQGLKPNDVRLCTDCDIEKQNSFKFDKTQVKIT